MLSNRSAPLFCAPQSEYEHVGQSDLAISSGILVFTVLTKILIFIMVMTGMTGAFVSTNVFTLAHYWIVVVAVVVEVVLFSCNLHARLANRSQGDGKDWFSCCFDFLSVSWMIGK